MLIHLIVFYKVKIIFFLGGLSSMTVLCFRLPVHVIGNTTFISQCRSAIVKGQKKAMVSWRTPNRVNIK